MYAITSSDLGGVGRQYVELVHHQTQFAQVDVKVDHQISRQGWREHLLLGERSFQVCDRAVSVRHYITVGEGGLGAAVEVNQDVLRRVSFLSQTH